MTVASVTRPRSLWTCKCRSARGDAGRTDQGPSAGFTLLSADKGIESPTQAVSLVELSPDWEQGGVPINLRARLAHAENQAARSASFSRGELELSE